MGHGRRWKPAGKRQMSAGFRGNELSNRCIAIELIAKFLAATAPIESL
jgi:hypothetical protein